MPHKSAVSVSGTCAVRPSASGAGAAASVPSQSPPAVVELARPSSLYITDEADTLPLTWSLANFNGDGKEFRLVITNNTTCLALPT